MFNFFNNMNISKKLITFFLLVGLIPLLLSRGIGSEVQRPLAIVVVSGLFSSTLLTLIVIPLLYKWFSPKMVKDK